MAYTVPDLGYAFDALEPHIDARTMEIHHDKHHAAYVMNLNAALEGTGLDDQPVARTAELAGRPFDHRRRPADVRLAAADPRRAGRPHPVDRDLRLEPRVSLNPDVPAAVRHRARRARILLRGAITALTVLVVLVPGVAAAGLLAVERAAQGAVAREPEVAEHRVAVVRLQRGRGRRGQQAGAGRGLRWRGRDRVEVEHLHPGLHPTAGCAGREPVGLRQRGADPQRGAARRRPQHGRDQPAAAPPRDEAAAAVLGVRQRAPVRGQQQ